MPKHAGLNIQTAPFEKPMDLRTSKIPCSTSDIFRCTLVGTARGKNAKKRLLWEAVIRKTSRCTHSTCLHQPTRGWTDPLDCCLRGLSQTPPLNHTLEELLIWLAMQVFGESWPPVLQGIYTTAWLSSFLGVRNKSMTFKGRLCCFLGQT